MATTTTHYGFDIPQSTDLVKDGATAIATLGQDIDTAMNTALGTKKAGMVLIGTTNFGSGVTEQSVNNVFTSAYSNYKIIGQGILSTGADINYRLRAAGVDDSGNNYRDGRWYMGQSGSIAFTTQQNSTRSFIPLATFTTTSTSFIIDIVNPQKSLHTTAVSFGSGLYALNTSATNVTTTAFDGFTILAASGTFSSGTIRVYAYNE